MQSIAEEIRAVAGVTRQSASDIHHVLLIKPAVALQAATVPAAVTVFTYTVPKGFCLLLTRGEVDSYPKNPAGDSFEELRQKGFYFEGFTSYWKSNGESQSVENADARFVNGEMFTAFKAGELKLICMPPVGTVSLVASFRFSGFLLSSSLFDSLLSVSTKVISN